MYTSKIIMYTCIDNYVDMQDNYVDMQDIYVYVGFRAFCCASMGVPMCVCDLWINQVWLVM